MANLHYENLGRLSESPATLSPSQQMRQCLLGFGPVQYYLRKARDGLERLIREIDCAPVPPPGDTETARLSPRRRLERKLAKLQPKGKELAWVQLRPAETEEGDAVFREFLEAEFVYDRKERRQEREARIRVRDCDEERGALALERVPRGTKLFLRPNPYTLDCQIRALSRLQSSPLPHHLPLLRLTEDPSRAEWPEVQPEEPTAWALLTDPSRPGASEQRGFVATALGTPDFAILIGPPGAGKTVSICELIVQMIRRGKRVMLCASTHVAVDNVLEKLADRDLTEKEVIAIRIGESRKVSELTKPFQLEERLKTERLALMKFLRSLRTRGAAQEYLLKALMDDPADEFLTRLILECSNLVCGTTIGILKHPYIRGGESGGAPFDMLIIDEVSKTTFQEFVVPALLAKRWVLVGDTRQLAPFVEEEEVKANIEVLLDQDSRKACATVLSARSKKGGAFVTEESPQVRDLITVQAEALGSPAVHLDQRPENTSPQALLNLLGSQVAVSAPSLGSAWESSLPSDMANLSGISLPLHLRRQTAHLRRKPRLHEDEATWEGQVAWRLIRLFDMRDLQGSEASAKLEADLEALIPQWFPEGKRTELKDNLDQIRQMSFPSVLEVLEQGYRGSARSRPTTLARGLPRPVLDSRRVELSFQHRMHPAISRFPHGAIYEGRLLRDPPGMETRRRLPFTLYDSPSQWIHVTGSRSDGRNANVPEAERLMMELGRLREHAKSHKPLDAEHRDGMWEAAVLTFYRPQESRLRELLKEAFGQRGRRQHFDDPSSNLRVHLATVDRIQGHEADFVYLSFVQTSRVGFLNVPNRLNVALTRARYQLVLLGNHAFFRNQEQSDLLRKLAEAHATPDLSLPKSRGR